MNFPPVSELLPHRPPMIVIDEVVAAGNGWVETRTRVTAEHVLFDTNARELPGWALIELMAQTAAVFGGLPDHAEQRAIRIGYLLGTRRFELFKRGVSENAVLHVRAVREFHDPDGMGAFDCTVSHGGDTVAEARLNVYQTDNQPTDNGAFPG